MFGRSNEFMKTINPTLSINLLCAGLMTGILGCASPHPGVAAKKVLVVTTTTGFRHSSIPTAERIIAQLGQQSGSFTVDYARVEPNDPQFKGADGKPDKDKVNEA